MKPAILDLDIQSRIAKGIYAKAVSYANRIRDEVLQKNMVYESTKARYRQSIAEYQKKQESIKSEISSLQSERKTLGLFSFSKKRSIDSRINELQLQLQQQSDLGNASIEHQKKEMELALENAQEYI